MTNVRASNLHPTFLLRDILPFLGPSCFNVGRRFSFVPVNITSSPRRRHRQPSFALTALLSSPKPPSTGRNRTLMSWLSVEKARRAIKPTFWQIASVFIMWEYSCGRHPVGKRIYADDWDDFRRIRKRTRYTEILFSLPSDCRAV